MRRLSGMTLVEMLVVIAIIGLLIALLLPAVQSVREAARRTQCMNNVKQIGLALLHYHHHMAAFPIGCRGDATYMGNWRASILPQLEQTALNDKLNAALPTKASGFAAKRNDGITFTGAYGTGAYNVLAGLAVNGFVCPSNTTDRNFNSVDAPNMNNAERGQTHSYVGIAGAAPDPGGRAGNCSSDWPNRGIFCRNGMLPFLRIVTINHATDGASNVLMIGEQSGLINAQPITANYQGGWSGWHRGSSGVNDELGDKDQFGSGVTTLRYAINLQSSSPPNGTQQAFHHNTILGSFHPGGTFVGLADGAVRWLADDISLTTLLRLGARADGQSAIDF